MVTKVENVQKRIKRSKLTKAKKKRHFYGTVPHSTASPVLWAQVHQTNPVTAKTQSVIFTFMICMYHFCLGNHSLSNNSRMTIVNECLNLQLQRATVHCCHVNSSFAIWSIMGICMQIEKNRPPLYLNFCAVITYSAIYHTAVLPLEPSVLNLLF